MTPSTATTAVMKKIAALLRVTQENGATEAEAMAAAQKAAELMAKHQVNMDEAALAAEGVIRKGIHWRNTGHIRFAKEFLLRDRMAMCAAKYTGCELWVDYNEPEETMIQIVGLQSDVELVEWLTDMLSVRVWALAIEKTAHIPGEKQYHRRAYILGFTTALMSKISAELAARKGTPDDTLPTGNSLMVVKQELAKRVVEGLDLNLKTGKSSTKQKGAYASGRADGAKQNLGRPVGSSSDTKRLK